MSYFVATSTFGFFMLAVIWSSKTWANFSIKMFLSGVSFWGAYLLIGPENLLSKLF